MPKSYCQVFVHYVWSTWDRLPLLTPDIEPAVHREICQEATRLGCDIVNVGGTENHVHLLVRLPPTVCVFEVAKAAKGASSLFVNDTLRPDHTFKWQGSYSAFSVSRWNVNGIAGYIANQKQHHERNTWKPQLEADDWPSEGRAQMFAGVREWIGKRFGLRAIEMARWGFLRNQLSAFADNTPSTCSPQVLAPGFVREGGQLFPKEPPACHFNGSQPIP